MSWVNGCEETGFGLRNLPYGVFSPEGRPARVGIAIGDHVLDLAGLAAAGLIEAGPIEAGPGGSPPGAVGWFAGGSLNPFMAAGRAAWQANRGRVTELLTDESYRPRVEPYLLPLDRVRLLRPFEVADYVDFYSSLDHATNAGRILRPGAEPLPRNWRHLPAGYHGRAGTVQVSGTPVRRPCGQRLLPGEQAPSYGPSAGLDFEAEIGFVAGVPSGGPVPTSGFRTHVFGFVLVNDWSARDLQFWEAQPLGPFLGKSFATSISPWVVPVAALEEARVEPPAQDPLPLPYLRCDDPWGLDLSLEVSLNGQVVSRPEFASMYWTPPQQLAHATVNGAALRTGDLFASGTVSGPNRDQRGCLLELTWNGAEPLVLPDGGERTYLEDGDTLTVRATAPGGISFGEVSGTVGPAAARTPQHDGGYDRARDGGNVSDGR